jgi:hypothetical protein
MQDAALTLLLGTSLLATSLVHASLIQGLAAEFVNMPETALDHPEWNQNFSSIDIELVPAEVIVGLLENHAIPSFDEEVMLRLIGDLKRIEGFTVVVRAALFIKYEGGRVAGYAFAIDEWTSQECYGFYALYFFGIGDLANETL